MPSSNSRRAVAGTAAGERSVTHMRTAADGFCGQLNGTAPLRYRPRF